MSLRQRLRIEWLAIAVITSLLVVIMLLWDATQKFDNLLYDQLSSYSRPIASDDILIVSIDEQSLADYGKWPWSRDRHSQLFEALAPAKPRAIGLDVLLSEHGFAENDAKLAAAIASNENVFLPLHFVRPGTNGAEYDRVLPVSLLAEASDGLGHVNLNFDDDGKVRRASLCFRAEIDGEITIWPHLMEQLYRVSFGRPSPMHSRLGKCDTPILVPFSERDEFQSISFSSIANGEVPSAFLADKIILIGATANGLGDQYPTPQTSGGTQAGVVIMANLLNAMINDNFVKPIAIGWAIFLSLVPMLVMLVGFFRWKPRNALIASMSLIALVLGISALLLTQKIWFAPGAALVGLALIYPAWGWRRLQATSDFMGAELRRLQISQDKVPMRVRPAGAVDLVTGQAEALNRAIEQLRDLRRFISDALTNLPDPMLIADLDGKVTFVNKLADQGLDGDSSQLTMDEAIEQLVSTDDLPKVRNYMTLSDASVNDTGSHDETPEENGMDSNPAYVRFVSTDDLVFAMRRAPIVSGEGELRGHIHYFADITAMANASREREEVLQLLSHDMRAPQAAILALLDRKEAWANSDKGLLSRIDAQARRTLRLADDFVDLAQMKVNPYEPEELLLADLAQEACDHLWPLASARNVRFELVDNSDAGFIYGEPSSLNRALINLMDNAVKYSPAGGLISVTVALIEKYGASYLQLEVQDQGKGIDPSILGNLFDRFVTNSENSASQLSGFGLGLNFVEAVVKRHGGEITASNSEHAGAKFCVLFRRADVNFDLPENEQD